MNDEFFQNRQFNLSKGEFLMYPLFVRR